ncbi:hypothetical protein J1P26_20125 [Neobacillus sp. MM2021_6]|uniref:hypothetical protein n=1 Tax=Bacillaceae TaxID=186817 RepID=UPI00140C208E|nr:MULTISPECIES: hypothetical protein [Bacillaceae]MBO0962016.1 hypothetical protein [Neobacillus sp. MM2021_6]NHC20289.1 hypothetical protein [Bacillus sp. MM2020_4]
MAKYKTLPNYELFRPEIHVRFNFDGIYETEDKDEIKYLNKCAPFIERVDKPNKKTGEKDLDNGKEK